MIESFKKRNKIAKYIFKSQLIIKFLKLEYNYFQLYLLLMRNSYLNVSIHSVCIYDSLKNIIKLVILLIYKLLINKITI